MVFPPIKDTEPFGSLAPTRRNRQVPPAAARHKNSALAGPDVDGRAAAASNSLPVPAYSPARSNSDRRAIRLSETRAMLTG